MVSEITATTAQPAQAPVIYPNKLRFEFTTEEKANRLGLPSITCTVKMVFGKYPAAVLEKVVTDYHMDGGTEDVINWCRSARLLAPKFGYEDPLKWPTIPSIRELPSCHLSPKPLPPKKAKRNTASSRQVLRG